MSLKRPSLPILLRQAIFRLFADEAIPLAGNIAFRTLFSVFPFLIFLTALAGFFGTNEQAELLVNYLLSIAPEQIVNPLAGEIRSILTVQRTGLLSVAALLTIWSAMAGVDSVRVGLNRAYGFREQRPGWWLYLVNILFVIGSAVILLALSFLLIVLPIALATIEKYIPAAHSSFAALEQLRFPLALLLLFIGLYIAHRVLPSKRLPPRKILPGVVVTVVVWIILTAAFSEWLQNFNSFASTYASLSGLFTAMFFLYLAALVLILGGEINRVIELHANRRSASGSPLAADPPMDASPTDQSNGF
jgi:membrane protein